MIDTDKYEGHAKEGWHFDSAHVLRDGYDKEIAELVGEDWLDDKATQELITDSPLLLAEVKRLRDELDTQYEYIEWLEEFAPKAGEYNTSWDAYELAKGIHWTQMEEEE